MTFSATSWLVVSKTDPCLGDLHRLKSSVFNPRWKQSWVLFLSLVDPTPEESIVLPELGLHSLPFLEEPAQVSTEEVDSLVQQPLHP